MRERKCWFRAAIVCAFATVSGCGPSRSAEVRWTCPTGWVASARGGCGPAALLCATDGAAAGVCDGVTLAQPPEVTAADATTHRALGRAPSGELVGGWPAMDDAMIPAADFQPNAPMEVPAVGWTPAAPRMTCAAGWTARDGLCDPALSTTCEPNTAAIPGATCTPTGMSSCPMAPYATAPAGATALRYVRADAAMGGDGTIERPFRAISDAVDSAPAGAVVLVGDGEYAPVTASRAVTVLGRCAATVQIVAGATGSALTVSAEGVRVESVTLRGGISSVRVNPMATLTLANSVVRGARAYGVSNAGVATIERSWITEVSDDPDGSAGVYGEGGSRTTLSRVAVTDNARAGVFLQADGALRDVTLARNGVTATDGATYGLHVRNGTVSLERAAVLANRQYGVYAALTAALTVTDAFVAQTGGAVTSSLGRAVDVEAGASVTLSRLGCESNPNGCIVQFGPSMVQAEDVVVREASRTRGRFGLYFSNATATVLRADVSGVSGTSVLSTRGARATLTDVRVRGASGGDPGQADSIAQSGATLAFVRARLGEGSMRPYVVGAKDARSTVTLRASVTIGSALADLGATLEADAVRFTGDSNFSLAVARPGSTMRLRDAVIEGTGEVANVARVSASESGALELRRVELVANALAGVLAATGARVTLEDVSVRALVRAAPVGMTALADPFAIAISDGGAVVTATRVRTTMSSGQHYTATGEGSSITVRESALVGERSDTPCDNCAGAVATTQAALVLDRVRVSGVRGHGIGAEDGGRLTVTRSIVRDLLAPTWTTGARRRYGAAGLIVRASSTAEVRGLRVEGAVGYGVLASNEATLTMRDSLVRGTRSGEGDYVGWGVACTNGARADLRGVAVDGAREVGLFTALAGARMALTDVVVRDVSASARGAGWGAAASSGGSITFERLAIERVRGVGLAATEEATPNEARATVTGADLLVRAVQPSTVQLDANGRVPRGTPASYALSLAPRATMTAERALVWDAGYGLVSANGTLALRRAVVTGMLDALGAVEGAEPTLSEVWAHQNARDTIERGAGLQSAVFSLPTDLGL